MANENCEHAYSDDSLWDKVENFAKAAGESALELALKIFYAATDNATSMWVKTTSTVP